MSIDQKDIIDFISEDADGTIVLTISDHLDWDEKNMHLLILQEKLNCYLAFIESGQLIVKYPKSAKRKVAIQVVAKHEPSADGYDFLASVRAATEGAGYELRLKRA